MRTAPQLQADQAELAWRKQHKKSGTVFIGWDEPEADARSFPCSTCGTPIESRAAQRASYIAGHNKRQVKPKTDDQS